MPSLAAKRLRQLVGGAVIVALLSGCSGAHNLATRVTGYAVAEDEAAADAAADRLAEALRSDLHDDFPATIPIPDGYAVSQTMGAGGGDPSRWFVVGHARGEADAIADAIADGMAEGGWELGDVTREVDGDGVVRTQAATTADLRAVVTVRTGADGRIGVTYDVGSAR